MQFASAALPVLINMTMPTDDQIHWRKHLESHVYPVDITLFYGAAKKGIEKGFVKYILHQQPISVPEFLKDIKTTEIG